MKSCQILSFLLVATLAIACKKEVRPTTPRLVKITRWNPTTGAERLEHEFFYDKTRVQFFKNEAGNIYTPSYSANGNVEKVIVSYPSSEMHVKFVYNDNNILIKKIVETVSNNPPRPPSMIEYDINSEGKITKITFEGQVTQTYTWKGDNLFEMISYLPPPYGNSRYRYGNYDDKPNPLTLLGVLATMLTTPISRNNPLGSEAVDGNGNSVNPLHTGYTYNSHGYPTSVKYSETDGKKYYYTE